MFPLSILEKQDSGAEKVLKRKEATSGSGNRDSDDDELEVVAREGALTDGERKERCVKVLEGKRKASP